MNQLKVGNAPLGKPWTKRLIKIKHIHDGAQWLAYLGLLGTVIGFIISLSGIDVGTLALVQGVQAMIPSLMAGMKVALYTTLAGGFFTLVSASRACLARSSARRAGRMSASPGMTSLLLILAAMPGDLISNPGASGNGTM